MHSDSQPAEFKRGFNFWMVYVSNLVVDMLSALDITAIAISLPTTVGELHRTDFVRAGSVYAIASSTAVLPFIGNLASAFGRKPVLLGFIVTFAIGSAISGAAQSMNMLIAGRNLPEPHAEQPVFHTAPAPERKHPEYW